jgi:hypothetical protein
LGAAASPVDAAAIAVPPAVAAPPVAAALPIDAMGSVLPMLASAPAVVAATPPPPLALPAVPGLPDFPTELTLPHDLVCAGTAWSANADGAHHDTDPSISSDRARWDDGRHEDG